MKKELIRKEYFKLKIKGHTNNQCRKIIKAKHDYEITVRTLRRWTHRINNSEWNLTDNSKRPKTIHTKITPKIENKVLEIRSKTRWGEKRKEIITLDLRENILIQCGKLIIIIKKLKKMANINY